MRNEAVGLLMRIKAVSQIKFFPSSLLWSVAVSSWGHGGVAAPGSGCEASLSELHVSNQNGLFSTPAKGCWLASTSLAGQDKGRETK